MSAAAFRPLERLGNYGNQQTFAEAENWSSRGTGKLTPKDAR